VDEKILGACLLSFFIGMAAALVHNLVVSDFRRSRFIFYAVGLGVFLACAVAIALEAESIGKAIIGCVAFLFFASVPLCLSTGMSIFLKTRISSKIVCYFLGLIFVWPLAIWIFFFYSPHS